MATSPDLFERRNRVRIVAVVLLAACTYVLAVALAAVAVTLATVLLAVFNFEIYPDSVETLEWFAYAIGAICVVAFAVGLLIAVVRIPFARRTVEGRVLEETGAVVVEDDSHTEVRNLLDGLAIAADIPRPRFAVVDDPAPNSFGVGTRPDRALVAVTTGLGVLLTRAELEAVLAYEVVRIRNWDVALATWTVALTSEAIRALDRDGGALSALIGWIPRRLAVRLQCWALRDQGVERDRAAVRFTRNPVALVKALEKLDRDPTEVGRVSRSTAPLWIEVPAGVVAGSSSRDTRRLAQSLLLDERIAVLRELAHAEASVSEAGNPPNNERPINPKRA